MPQDTLTNDRSPQNGCGDSVVLAEIRESLRLLRELALCAGQSGSVKLDELMDTKQAAKWLGMEAKTLMKKARTGVIPCVAFPKTQVRFHPLTILAKGHSFYARDASRLLK